MDNIFSNFNCKIEPVASLDRSYTCAYRLLAVIPCLQLFPLEIFSQLIQLYDVCSLNQNITYLAQYYYNK